LETSSEGVAHIAFDAAAVKAAGGVDTYSIAATRVTDALINIFALDVWVTAEAGGAGAHSSRHSLLAHGPHPADPGVAGHRPLILGSALLVWVPRCARVAHTLVDRSVLAVRVETTRRCADWRQCGLHAKQIRVADEQR